MSAKDQKPTSTELSDVQQGLRMAHPPDPDSLAREREFLAGLESVGSWARARSYLRLIGPGYLQSAMTLGGGTAVYSLFAGAAFGYQLLWVAPVAMLLGLIMLTAISYQTLSTGLRPFQAMKQFAGAPLAWGWAVGALVASIIWHFPQYSLASAVLVDMGSVVGITGISPQVMSFVVLAWAIFLSFLYGSSPGMVRVYERLLKYMVWGIVLCFGIVVFKTGISDWGALARGFFAFEVPDTKEGVAATTVVVSGLAAAVGINMVFLYPYSLLARGWGREHRRLARFDLGLGMFLPYLLASSLMIIATANTFSSFDGQSISPVQAAGSISSVIGPNLGRLVFGLGILGMALSSITLHMICSGFVCMELFGWEVGSWRYRLATLLPTPGVLGPLLWQDHLLWLAVPTNIICGCLLPIAYIGFIVLQRSERYLGRDKPRGLAGKLWLTGMILATAFMASAFAYYIVTRVFLS